MTKEERFNEIYEKYRNLVWWHLNDRIRGSYADKEDINQQIWMGIWNSIDKIEPGKEHAFLYKVITNQIYNFYYYSTRDKKFFRSDAEETSEGEEFSISELCKEVRYADDYEYFEIMDAIESVLTEKEFEVFMAYFQGLPIHKMVKQLHTKYSNIMNMLESIKSKLTYEFGMEATFPNLKKRNRQKKTD